MEDLEIIYLQTKNEKPNAKVNGYYLHSNYNPEAEAEKYINNNYKEGYLNILFGYGLGYIANAIAKKYGNTDILVYDPLFSSLNIENKDEIEGVFSDLQDFCKRSADYIADFDRKVNILISPNYDKIFSSEYKEFLDFIHHIQIEDIVNENTIRFFGDLWQENYIMNLYYVHKDQSLKALYNKYDCPVILASGGPSLTKQLPLLKEIKDKCLIISAGSTINSLLAADIIPDYVVTMDGGESNYLHFKNIKNYNFDLIYGLGNAWQIERDFKGNRYSFCFYGEDSIQKRIKEGLGRDLPMLSTGGTVAITALEIASKISTGPIAIIGQDLAYTNNKSHAENNNHYSELTEEFFMKDLAFEIEGYYGEPVKTNHQFNSMRKSIERLYVMLQNQHIIYNCTEGGVKINGMPQLDFTTFCKNYMYNSINVPKLKFDNEINNNRSIYKEFMNQEIEVYLKIKKLLVEAIYLLKEERNNTVFSASTLKKLDKIDSKLKEYYPQVIMERIIDPITMDVVRMTLDSKKLEGKEKFKQIYKQNMYLYENILEATEKSLKYTRVALDEFGGY
ncbi:motility associated factor glycosyltransferase family protein [Lysinibacillus tabacifolii]|uniref:Motility associated factor glycosyltransferase family protein n=1 Tax=Lysinibacillus tabacifolii TaxID=1173107 RepID=A0ABY2T1H2_9BACI|nr:6-hydroxymethylpterin diphosphokinase MptE-like protein [Lysinibacillus tabacifolii]TKI48734.1 motility associated factor glycosyltransferase family protein [Lysinibacillus tabacifolii]